MNVVKKILIGLFLVGSLSACDDCGGDNYSVVEPADSIVVTSANGNTLYAGVPLQLKAIAKFTNPDTEVSPDVTASTTWGSADTTKIVVSATGLAEIANNVTAGSSEITSMYNGKESKITLTVSGDALVSVTVTPSTFTLYTGGKTNLKAIAKFGTTDVTVTKLAEWTSSDITTVTVGADNGTATYISAGSTMINAKFTSMNDTSIITTSANLISKLEVSSTPAIVDSKVSVALGTPKTFKATATFTNTFTDVVTYQVNWISSDETVATIDDRGVATTLAMGSTNITAEFTSNKKVTSTPIELTVTAAEILAIAIEPKTASVAKGMTHQLKAMATYTNSGKDTDGNVIPTDVTELVTWTQTIGNVGTATINNNDKKGLVTATTTLDKTLFTATLDDATTEEAQLSTENVTAITITAPDNITRLRPASAPIQLIAMGTLTNGAIIDITKIADWTISVHGAKVVTELGNTATDKGIATLATSRRISGASTIQAEFDTIGTIEIFVSLSVVQSSIITVPILDVLDKKNLPLGATRQARVISTYTRDGGTADVTPHIIGWASADENIATISDSGLITPVAEGSSLISTNLHGSVFVTGLTITVVPVELESIILAGPAGATTVTVGGTDNSIGGEDSTLLLVMIGVMSNNKIAPTPTPNDYNWTSNNNLVATVVNGKITAVRQGTATITATLITAGDMGNISNTFDITVLPNPAL